MVEDQVVARGKRDEAKEQRWRGVLEECQQSGKSVRAFCRERGLKEASFYRWRQVIRQRDRETVRVPGNSTSQQLGMVLDALERSRC